MRRIVDEFDVGDPTGILNLGRLWFFQTGLVFGGVSASGSHRSPSNHLPISQI
jgi:hypothetical protein